MVSDTPLGVVPAGTDANTRPAGKTGNPAAARDGATAKLAVSVAGTPHNDKTQFSLHELESAIKKIESSVTEVRRSLVFSIDDESGDPVITVVDRDTREVIRKIPPDEVLSVAERFGTGTPSLLTLKA